MSQKETDVEISIVTLSAEGLSKQAAAAKMMVDFPQHTLHGIRPEPEDGEWVGIMHKTALSKFDDDNTVSFPNGSERAPGESNAVEPLTPQDGPPEPDFPEGPDEGDEEDAARDGDIKDILLDIKDLLLQVTGGEGQSGQLGVGGFRGGQWGSTDESPLDEGPIVDEQEDMGLLDKAGFGKPEDKPFGKGSAVRVTREREDGMSLRQARIELQKEAATQPHLRNYRIQELDVSEDGTEFEATLVPKNPPRRRPRNKRR